MTLNVTGCGSEHSLLYQIYVELLLGWEQHMKHTSMKSVTVESWATSVFGASAAYGQVNSTSHLKSAVFANQNF